MANRERGEVSLRVDGQSYTLVLNTNAMGRMEELFSTATREVTWDQVWSSIMRGSVRHIRALLWAMLQKYHPEMTLADTGELVDRAGGLEGLTEVLMAAQKSNTPDADDVRALGVNAKDRPQTAQARKRGTGAASIGKPVASV